MVRMVDHLFVMSFSQFGEPLAHNLFLAAPIVSHINGPYQSSAALLEPGCVYRPDSSSVLDRPNTSPFSWSYGSMPPVNVAQVVKGFSSSN